MGKKTEIQEPAPTPEDESRLVRVVTDIRNVNIIIKFWANVQEEALKASSIDDAAMATTYLKQWQDVRATHGLAPLELPEPQFSGEANTSPGPNDTP